MSSASIVPVRLSSRCKVTGYRGRTERGASLPSTSEKIGNTGILWTRLTCSQNYLNSEMLPCWLVGSHSPELPKHPQWPGCPCPSPEALPHLQDPAVLFDHCPCVPVPVWRISLLMGFPYRRHQLFPGWGVWHGNWQKKSQTTHLAKTVGLTCMIAAMVKPWHFYAGSHVPGMAGVGYGGYCTAWALMEKPWPWVLLCSEYPSGVTLSNLFNLSELLQNIHCTRLPRRWAYWKLRSSAPPPQVPVLTPDL